MQRNDVNNLMLGLMNLFRFCSCRKGSAPVAFLFRYLNSCVTLYIPLPSSYSHSIFHRIVCMCGTACHGFHFSPRSYWVYWILFVSVVNHTSFFWGLELKPWSWLLQFVLDGFESKAFRIHDMNSKYPWIMFFVVVVGFLGLKGCLIIVSMLGKWIIHAYFTMLSTIDGHL